MRFRCYGTWLSLVTFGAALRCWAGKRGMNGLRPKLAEYRSTG